MKLSLISKQNLCRMFSCFTSSFKIKGHRKIPVKVWDAKRENRAGFAAKSLKDLTNQVYSHFKISTETASTFVFEEDGTSVEEDEVFGALSPHSVLLLLVDGEQWTPRVVADPVGEIERALTALLESNRRRAVTNQILARIRETNDPQVSEMLGQLAATVSQNIPAETRTEDPEWFTEQPKSKFTKQAVMRDCAKRRIRKYYNNAVEHVKAAKKRKLPSEFEEIFDDFQHELRQNDHYGDYFDRTSALTDVRFCDAEGWFRCQGAYDAEKCSYYDHSINPYGSRQAYLVFSTWNLDHRIEKSREVLPSLLEAVKRRPRTKELNWIYFYELLFTRANLGLVHTACHDKGEHTTEKCDQTKYYVS